jgi:hypothetical protein
MGSARQSWIYTSSSGSYLNKPGSGQTFVLILFLRKLPDARANSQKPTTKLNYSTTNSYSHESNSGF